MLFFQLDFLLLFLTPLIIIALAFKYTGFRQVLPWVVSAASLIFLYVFSAISAIIALASLFLNYFAAVYLLKTRSKVVFGVTVFINLLALAYFKYSILISNTFFNSNTSWAWKIALPLGISFYTFQQIAFIADVLRGKVTSFTFKNYILFKLFFPQFVAGPITHYERVKTRYERWPIFNHRSIRFGLIIFSIGLIKKIIGDRLGIIADDGFNHQANLNAYSAWVSTLAFTFQIYFDFSGYSDMAVGLARIFGVNLPFNFNSPYKSRNLSDFWRRWHITLSQWLRDYLYIPLGGNRRGKVRMAFALFMTMALGGLWHGANFTFVLWGIAHGLGLILIRFFGVSLPAFFSRLLVFIFVMATWILFRSNTLGGAIQHYRALFNYSASDLGVELQRLINVFIPGWHIDHLVNKPNQIYEVLFILFVMLVCMFLPNSRQISLWLSARRVKDFTSLEIPVLATIIFILSLAFISPDTANAFIYFEF